MVPMEIAENRFEFPHHFAIERDVHPKNAVGGWVLRAHRDFHQIAFDPRSHRRRRFFQFMKSSRAHFKSTVILSREDDEESLTISDSKR
jgi:hypothetical protein